MLGDPGNNAGEILGRFVMGPRPHREDGGGVKAVGPGASVGVVVLPRGIRFVPEEDFHGHLTLVAL